MWQQPIRAKSVEKSGGLEAPDGMGRSLSHLLFSRYDLERIMRGEACANCLDVFPCRPGPETARKILREKGPRYRGGERVETLRLLKQGRCPLCKWEVSPEMARMMFSGETALKDAPILEGTLERARLQELDAS